jgi:Heterokaryon incompatibility protein (HET)
MAKPNYSKGSFFRRTQFSYTPVAKMYPYQPLNVEDRHIRLLHPEQLPSDSSKSPIRLTTSHISLSKPCQYWTLSYTWGAPFEGLPPEWDNRATTHTIYVNGHEFEIQWNLEAALKLLCSIPIPTIWIDAICIYASRHRVSCRHIWW